MKVRILLMENYCISDASDNMKEITAISGKTKVFKYLQF